MNNYLNRYKQPSAQIYETLHITQFTSLQSTFVDLTVSKIVCH